MLFLIWSQLWVYWSGNPWMLCAPAIAVLARAAYLSRPVIHWVQFLVILGSLLVFLYQLALRETLFVAGLFSMKVVVSSLILNHLFLGIRDVDPSRFGADAGTFIVLFDRCRSLVSDRLRDVVEAFRVRRRASSAGYTRKRLILGTIRTAFAEIWALGAEIDRMRKSRGNIPVTAGWTVPRLRRNFVGAADVLLFFLVIFATLVGDDRAIPEKIGGLVKLMREVAAR